MGAMAKESAAGKIAKGARSVTIAVLLSRLLGLVREQVLAGLFGAGFQMDAYVVAYRIPNLLRDLLAEGALASAFVTVFSHYKEREGLAATWRLAQKALGTILALVLGIVLLGELLAPFLVKLLAPGFSPEKWRLATHLTRIMFPFLACASISAVFAGMLNTFRVFFLPAVSSAVFNLVSVCTGVLLYFWFVKAGITPIAGMAVGVVLGGLAQVGIQVPALKKRGFSFRLGLSFKDPGVREIFRLMFPMVVGLSAVQLSVFVNTYFASFCGEGALSWLSYAFRIMYVPLGLFGVALSVAVLPVASSQVARGEFEALRRTYISSLLMALSLALPSAVGLLTFSEPIVKLIFERGRFTPQDTLNTALALSLFALALPAYASTKVSTPLFYALKRPKIPMVSSFLSVTINLLVVLATLKNLGFRAIALGTSIGICAQAFFQVLFLSSIVRKLNWREFLAGAARILLASLLMGVPAYLLKARVLELEGLKLAAATLGVIALCGGVYFALVALLGPREGLYLFRSLRKR